MSGINNILSLFIIIIDFYFLIPNINKESTSLIKQPYPLNHPYLGEGRGKDVFPCRSDKTFHRHPQTFRPTRYVFKVIQIGLVVEYLLCGLQLSVLSINISVKDV